MPDRKRGPVRISARNQLEGKLVEIVAGATTAHVRLVIVGSTVTSAITNAAVDELGLPVGQQACAVVKASGVFIAVDRDDARISVGLFPQGYSADGWSTVISASGVQPGQE